MAFRNIFELGECDVFVRWNDYHEDTSRGTTLLININDLPTNPSSNGYIGTVQVINNEVVCNFDYDIDSGGGHWPTIVVVPKFDYSKAIGARVTEVAFNGPTSPGGSTYVGFVGRLTKAGLPDDEIMQYTVLKSAPGYVADVMQQAGSVYLTEIIAPIPSFVGANELPGVGVDYESIGH